MNPLKKLQRTCAVSAAPPGMVLERFIADTGANRSVHPNPKSAFNYFPLPLDISTASGSKSMKSEGVGVMKLYTPTKKAVSGFDRVIFCKNVTEKLCSVGELCDAGYVFVFDDKKLTMYEQNNFSVKGNIITSDLRDERTKLYPINLYRDLNEKNGVQNVSTPSVSVILAPPCPSLSIIEQRKELPLVISDKPSAALLAKSYINPSLSDIDRFHAKFGDVGIKYLKRCMPNLKIPNKYRCDICIDGKIHKFGHKKCAEGVRREFLPGVCIHSDHSGLRSIYFWLSLFSALS
jgi:hypothetical protein